MPPYHQLQHWQVQALVVAEAARQARRSRGRVEVEEEVQRALQTQASVEVVEQKWERMLLGQEVHLEPGFEVCCPWPTMVWVAPWCRTRSKRDGSPILYQGDPHHRHSPLCQILLPTIHPPQDDDETAGQSS